jgi:hypothetical protein
MFPIQKTIKFPTQAQQVVEYRNSPRHSTQKYRLDGSKQHLVQTFLGKGPDSPRENEDIVAMVADDSGTC